MQSICPKFPRFLLVAGGMAALCLFTAPLVLAGSADGTYKIKRITNQFYDNGEPYKVPAKELRESLFNMDGIVIENNRLPIYQNQWFKDLKKPEYRDAFATLEMKGPRRIRLSRNDGGVFRGKSGEPLVANFAFVLLDQKLPIRVKSRARGKVTGNELVMNMDVRLILRDKSPAKEHYIIKGRIQITAEKTEPIPATNESNPT